MITRTTNKFRAILELAKQRHSTPEWLEKERLRLEKIEHDKKRESKLLWFNQEINDIKKGLVDAYSIPHFIRHHLPDTKFFNDDVLFFIDFARAKGMKIVNDENGITITRGSELL